MLGSGSAQAASIVIDDFSIFQDVGLQPIGFFIPSSSQVGADASIIGGFRDIEAMGNAGVPLQTRITADNGVLDFANSVDTTGSGVITWDGDDDPTVVDPTGLGGIDLTNSGLWPLDRILVEIISADLPGLELNFTIYDLDSNVSTLSRTFTQAITTPETATFLFDDFSGTADFTNVGAIKLELAGPTGIDAEIDSIQIGKDVSPKGTPEPASILGLLAIGAVGAGSKLKRK